MISPTAQDLIAVQDLDTLLDDQKYQISEVDKMVLTLVEDWNKYKSQIADDPPSWDRVNLVRDIAGWINEAVVNIREDTR